MASTDGPKKTKHVAVWVAEEEHAELRKLCEDLQRQHPGMTVTPSSYMRGLYLQDRQRRQEMERQAAQAQEPRKEPRKRG